MNMESKGDDAVAGMGTERRGSQVPVRWAIPAGKMLKKQATRLTIIEMPTEMETVDEEEDDDSLTSSTSSPFSWKRLCEKNGRCGSVDGDFFKLGSVQRRFLFQGLLVRALLMTHAFFVLYGACVTVHMAVCVVIMLLYASASVAEGVIMYKLRGFSQKKWICTSTLLYTVFVVPATWAMQMTLLKAREEDSYETCLESFGSCGRHPSNLTIKMRDGRSFVAYSYDNYELSVSFMQYTLVFVLIFCRWLLPRDNFTRQKVAEVLLVLVGSGEDIVEFATVIVSISHFACSRTITAIVLTLWSISIFQFSVAIPEKSAKVRQGKPPNAILNVWVDAVNQLLARRRQTVGDVSLYVAPAEETDAGSSVRRRRQTNRIKTANHKAAPTLLDRYDWVRTTEVREAIMSITLQDGPFLIFRLTILGIFGRVALSMIFYAFKNMTVIMLQIYRVYAMLVECRQRRRSSLFPVGNDEELDIDGGSIISENEEHEEIPTIVDKAGTYLVSPDIPEEREGDESDSRTPNGHLDCKADDSDIDHDAVSPPVALSASREFELRSREQRTIDETS